MKILVQLISIMVLITSCGGGGTNSGSPSSGSPSSGSPSSGNPSSGNPSSGSPSLDPDLAASMGFLGLSSIEGAVQLSQLVSSGLYNFAKLSSVEEVSVQIPCDNSNTYSASLLSGENYPMSAGDTLLLDYEDCQIDFMGARVSGSLSIEISASELTLAGEYSSIGTIDFNNELMLTNGDDTYINIDGDMIVEYTLTAASESIVARNAENNLRFSINNVVISTIGPFTTEKTAFEMDQTFLTALSGTFAFEGIPEFTCNGEFTGDDNVQFNTTGSNIGDASFTCSSAGVNRVQVTTQPDTTNGAMFSVDTNGNTSTLENYATASWGEILEGFIFAASTEQVDRPTEISPVAIQPQILDIDVTTLVYSKHTQLIYVANESGLSAVSPENQEIVEQWRMGEVPRFLSITPAGDAIYVAYENINLVEKFSLPEMESLYTILLDEPLQDLAISPQNPDLIAIVAGSFIGTSRLYENGIARTNTINSVSSLSFSPDGAHIYVQLGDAFAKYSFDDEGFTSRDVYQRGTHELVNFATELRFNAYQRVGDYLGVSNGLLYDPDSDHVVGNFNIGDDQLYSVTGVFDESGEHFYYYFQTAKNGRLFGYLVDFDVETRTPLATFDITKNANNIASDVRVIDVGSNIVAVAFEDSIRIVNKAQLIGKPLATCNTFEFSGNGDDGLSFVEIRCPINDVVYDDARNKIYATISSRIGLGGNSVATINPATGEIETSIFVGSDPSDITISLNGDSLFVNLYGEGRVAKVDIDNWQIIETFNMGIDEDNRLRDPEQIVASPIINDGFVAKTRSDELIHVEDATVLPNRVDNYSRRSPLFLVESRLAVFAEESFADVVTYTLDSSGIVRSSEIQNIFNFPEELISVQGKYFVNSGGLIFDLDSQENVAVIGENLDLSISRNIDVNSVLIDPESDRVFMYENNFEPELYSYSFEANELLSRTELPRLGDYSTDVIKILELGNNIGVLTDGELRIFSKQQLE